MLHPLAEPPFLSSLAVLMVMGICVGTFLVRAVWLWSTDRYLLQAPLCGSCGTPVSRWSWIPFLGVILTRCRCRECRQTHGWWVIGLPMLTGLVFAGYFWVLLNQGMQATPDVKPSTEGWLHRFGLHLALLSLLLAATGTDLRQYIIPDSITLTGVGIAFLGAALSGETQVIHLWIDWNQEIPGLQGPYVPEWIDQHRRWHAVAVAGAGLVVGAGMTWLVRIVSGLVLGQEALGFGDVTLMGMIGSFLGWQPVLFVFLLAPICGLFIGMLVRLLSNRPYVPYGPYLAAAAVLVMCTWKHIWMFQYPISPTRTFSVRKFFGDPVSLGILAGVSLVAFVSLLGLVRLYRNIPVSRRSANPSTEQGGENQAAAE